MKRKNRHRRTGRVISTARIPLPKKAEKRHGDRTKYRRSRERERLRGEIATSAPDERP